MDVIESDPRYKQATKFMKEKQYEDAIGIFSSLLQSCIETHGEMAVESACAYFAYGDALLTQEEENPSNGLLGNVEDENNDDDNSEDGDEEQEKGEEAENPDDQDNKEEIDPVDGDLQVAWEILDVARCILTSEKEKNGLDKDNEILLSNVLLRLGDLMRFNGNIAESLVEHNNALAIRSAICEPYDRLLSDVHFSLAVGHIYNSTEKDIADPLGEKKMALKHYKLSQQALEALVNLKESEQEKTLKENSSASQLDGELEEIRDLVQTLQETVEALEIEIQQVLSSTNTGSSSSGLTSSSISGFISSSGFTAPSLPINDSSVTTLQPKRKVEANESNTDKSEGVTVLAAKKKRPIGAAESSEQASKLKRVD